MHFSNVTEWIWSEELTSLLRMCGEKDAAIGADASDYERFCALCRSADLLRGNPTVHRISCLLSALLRCPVSLSAENAEVLWQKSAALLWLSETPDVLREDFAMAAPAAPSVDWCARLALSAFFDGNQFLNTSQRSWSDWRNEMLERCGNLLDENARGVSLTLPTSFVFSSPNPYQVGRVLQSETREDADQNLLIAQLVRFFSEECLRRDRALLCRVECTSLEAVKLFAYTEGQVGLPRLLWSLADLQEIDALIAFCGMPHQKPVEAALPASEASESRLAVFSKCYPLGKLHILI